MRWRRRVNRELSRLGLTFTQWLVLQTMLELIDETRDAVSLTDIVKRSGVDKTTVSQVMTRLLKANLVDIGPAMEWPGSRNYLTKLGERLTLSGAALVADVSVEWLRAGSETAA